MESLATESLTCNLRPLGNRLYLTEFVTPHTYLIDQLYPGLQGSTKQETVYSCLDWVCRNIRYKGERGDVFYMPSEAITKGTSDCEEQAFTLCSLLRACGLSPDEIFVALGTYGRLGGGHAWVTWLNGKYWVLEATLERAPSSIPEQAYPYQAYLLFNDQNTLELRSGFVISKKYVDNKLREIEEFYDIKVRK